MENLHRTFICIDLPKEIIQETTRIQELLKNKQFTGKITEPENLHLTLKFLGEISDEKLEQVKNALDKIKFPQLNLKLGNIGFFSYRGKPRIIWIKLQGKQIYALQKQIDSALKPLFKEEERFMGHLTIARIKYVKDPEGFKEHIKSLKLKQLEFSTDKFKLKTSELKPIGPTYTTIKEYEKQKP